ncbi:MAG: fimbrillin family protein [Muribaculaceae bacterium]|nr:fimbrillin family protein [Muribaculaceae bacterium]
MKLRHFFPCLLLAGMAVTVASCTDEANLTPGQGRNVTMTVNISRVGDNTRSILTENEGDLKCTWEAEDLILVVDGSGNKLGVLSLKNGAGEESATFVGEITTDAVGATDLNFLYLGSKSAEEFDALTNPVVLDYSAQNGTIEWLSKNDFFSGSENVEITNSYISVESVSLSRQISFGKFDMQLPAGVTYAGQLITVSGEGLNTKASISMTDGHATFSEEGNIVITRPEGTSSTEFYLTVLPAAITPTFSVTIDGKTYSCTLAQKEWEASKFVRKDNLDGTFSGIVLNMTDKTSENNPYEGYENEDPRNPLHKFAKYNLTRGEDNLNVFVENEDAYGALYQWGRYYGFIDRNDNTVFGKYNLSSKTYTQFAEALGSKSVNNNNDIWDYCVYDPDGSNMYSNPEFNDGLSMMSKVAVVTGMNYFYIGWFNSKVTFDYPHFYDSKSHIVTDQPCYYMNGIHDKSLSLQRHGSYLPAYIEEFSNSGDYWVDDFGVGGSNWSARAKAQGFTADKENPCPDGWRLPTESEMREIIPENGLYDKNGNLADMLNKYSELRETEKGIKYAIRWNYVNTNKYIEIEAVVVDETYTSVDQITDIFWNQHVFDKVVRKFPFTGGIRPYTGYVFGSSTWDTVICRPISMGKPAFQSYTVGDYEAIGLISPNETGGINNHFGGYWVNEKDLAMKFCAENFEREVNGNVRETESEYTRIRMEQTGPAFGMAIRPVMDK